MAKKEKSTPKLKVKKSKSVFEKSFQVDLKELFKALSNGVIHTACGKLISSMWDVRGRVKAASTIHMITPPIRMAHAITVRLSKFWPICFFSSHAGMAVMTNAMSVRLNGWVKTVRSPRSPLGNEERNLLMVSRK